MERLATSHSADCERLLCALGISTSARNVLTVDIALRPDSLVTLTVCTAMTEAQVASLADTLEAHPLEPRP